jgi:DHA1 family multidrug resistance protein-like MFS transporter
MPRPEPGSWQRNVWALSLIVFTAFVGFQFFSPFLPLYVKELGVTDPAEIAVWSGVLMAVTPGLAGLLGPLWGRLADRVGRKLMMVRSLAGFIVTIAAMGLVTSVSQLFVARLVQGIFAGFSVMAMALASVSCPRDKVPVAIGRVQSAQLLSAAVGPAAGGYVASHFGIRYAFFVTAGLCAVSLIGLMVLFTEERPGEATKRPAPLAFRDVFRLPHFAVVLGLLLIAQFIDRGLALLIPLKVAHLPGVERIAAVSGIIISVSAVCGTISASVAGRLAQDWPIGRLLLIACLTGAVPCALMAWTSSWVWLLVLRCLVGFSLGGALTLAYSLGGHLVPSDQRGAAFGWLALGVQFSSALSPVATGGLAALSLSGAFLFDGALAWVAAALLLLAARDLIHRRL